MTFRDDKLPLEYPPKEMLRIYRDRLLVFGGVVMANLLLLLCVMFALSHPVVFFIALGLIGAFGVGCWWSPRDARLVKMGEELQDKPLDLAGDAEAFAAIWALLGVSHAVAAPRHREVDVRLAGPQTLREVLEQAKRFQSDVVGQHFRRVARTYGTQSEKEEWLRLADMSQAVVDQVGAALEAIPVEDMEKDVSDLQVLRGEHNEVNSCVFVAHFIRDIEQLGRLYHLRPKSIVDVRPRSDEGSIVRWYVSSVGAMWALLLHEDVTSVTAEEIKRIKMATDELRSELIKVKGDSLKGNNQDHLLF